MKKEKLLNLLSSSILNYSPDENKKSLCAKYIPLIEEVLLKLPKKTKIDIYFTQRFNEFSFDFFVRDHTYEDIEEVFRKLLNDLRLIEISMLPYDNQENEMRNRIIFKLEQIKVKLQLDSKDSNIEEITNILNECINNLNSYVLPKCNPAILKDYYVKTLEILDSLNNYNDFDKDKLFMIKIIGQQWKALKW